jgi:hypothetical protein
MIGSDIVSGRRIEKTEYPTYRSCQVGRTMLRVDEHNPITREALIKARL